MDLFSVAQQRNALRCYFSRATSLFSRVRWFRWERCPFFPQAWYKASAVDTRVNFQNGEPNSAINDILILDCLFSSSLFASVWSVEVFLYVLPSIRMRAIIALKLMSFFGSPNSKHGTPLSRDGHGIEAGYLRIWRRVADKPCGSCECLFLSCSKNFPRRTKESRTVVFGRFLLFSSSFAIS